MSYGFIAVGVMASQWERLAANSFFNPTNASLGHYPISYAFLGLDRYRCDLPVLTTGRIHLQVIPDGKLASRTLFGAVLAMSHPALLIINSLLVADFVTVTMRWMPSSDKNLSCDPLHNGCARPSCEEEILRVLGEAELGETNTTNRI